MRSAYRHRTDSGFTLIELLVVFAISSLLVAAAFSGLNVGLSSWKRGSDRLERLRTGRIAMDLIVEQIRTAVPLTTEPDTISAVVAFTGSQTELRFVTGLSIPDGNGVTPRWVHLSWNPAAGSSGAGHLAVNESLILSPSNRPNPEPYWSAPIVEASSVEFLYLDGGGPGESPRWRASWPAGPATAVQLPQAVALIIRKGDGTQERTVVPLDSWHFAGPDARLR